MDWSELIYRWILFKKFTDVPFTGTVEGQFQGSVKDGNEGPWKHYHDNGRLESKGIQNNVRDGVWVEYYEDGNIKSKNTFKNGGYFRDCVFYHPNEQIMSIGVIENDQREGVWKTFHKNGSMESEGEYLGGLESGLWKSYYENGHLKYEGEYLGGLKSGPWKSYYENGQLGSEGETIVVEEIKKDGSKHKYSRQVGLWKTYFDDGNLKSEGIFEYTVEDHIGTTNFCKSYKTYHPNGNLSGEGSLRDGLKSGGWLCLKEMED